MKKWVSCLLVLAVLLTLCQGAALADSAAYAAGIYEGVSANGRNGEVAVEVTLSDTAIDQIVVTRHQETAGSPIPPSTPIRLTSSSISRWRWTP